MIEAEIYGMIPIAKIENRSNAPPENMLNMSRIVPPLLIKQYFEGDRIDPGHRDERTDPEYHQRSENEQQPLPEFGR